jgi:adenylate cyclase
MERTPVTRRLAAIVIADVVGYTRLMERDEAGTHARLREIRDTITDPKIAEYGGRIVKTAGDGMLVEFPSATAALRCAVEVQREMGHRNLYVAPDAKIEFRIGINLGDMLIDGDDIAGDGVNVAARLETLAEPGGICIGSTVYEQIHDDLGFGFVDIGEQQVKNIARPIRAYRVKLGLGAAHGQGNRQLFRGKRWQWLTGAVGVIAIGVVGAFFLRDWSGPAATVPTSAPTAGQAPALSIAILPFAVPGGNPSDDRLAESLTHDVTTALGRSARYAWVVSHGLASGYKGKAIDARAVGRELNVRYLAEGEIRHAGEKLVLNTILIDTGSATQVWNDRLDLSDAQLAAGYDAIAAQLAKRIKNALFEAESRRVQHQSTANATAVELWLRVAALDDRSLKGARDARKLYDEVLRLDPRLVGPLIGQVNAIENLMLFDPQADHDRLLQEMDNFSLRAVAADGNDPRAWMSRATALRYQWRWSEALEAIAEMLRIDPSRTEAYLERALVMSYSGQPGDALAQLDKAIAVDPRQADDGALLRGRCRAHLVLGHYDEAISACERAAALENYWATYMFLTAAYAQKEQMAKASGAKSQLLKFQPGFTIARFKAMGLTDNPVFSQQAETHIFAGLRKAGIPEQ